MTSRRAAPLALLLAAAACSTEVKQEAPPAEVVLAAFATDATNPAYLAGSPGPKIPQPNDLGLQAAAALPAGAQKELLQIFGAAGGFPSDQEVAITVPVRALRFSGGSYVPAQVPDLDLATVAANAVVLKLDGTVVPVAFEVGGYARSSDGLVGTLTLRKALANGNRRWPSGRYVVALRGGMAGIKTTAGVPLSAEQPIALISANQDLSNPNRQPVGGLTPAQVAQLEGLRGLYANALPWCSFQAAAGPFTAGWNPLVPPLPATLCARAPTVPSRSAFAAVAERFPLAELASIQTFDVAPIAGAVVAIDAGSGQAPLPIDLLRTGPPAAAGQPRTIAFNAAFGPAAAGLTTLDGFSTTAMLLAQTSDLIDAATVHAGSVFLYRLDGQNPPTRLWEVVEAAQEIGAGRGATPGFVAEPPPITQACPIASGKCSTVIGLQPAVGVPLTGTPLAGICPALAPGGCALYAPPLQQKTSYAVVITSRVRDAAGAPLVRSTVSRILLEVAGALHDDQKPAGQRSLLAGIDDATALALQTMRAELAPVLAALPAGTTPGQVAAAYTFRTQTVIDGAAGILAAFADPASAPAGQAAYFTPAQVGADYGIDPAVAFPAGVIQEFAEVTFATPNLLLSGNTQGALDPAHPTAESITALVALPNPASVTGTCPAGFAAARCAPLVIFRHGFPRAKADMLPVAAALAARGFVVAAIDAEKHGDRTYCTADNQCLPPAACVADPKLRTATDATVVGRCAGGALLRSRLDCAAFDPATCLSPKGIPLASGNLYVSANLFRTRDSARQDVVDQAVLVNTLAPAQPRAAGTDQLASRLLSYSPTVAIHPDQVYFASLSLGSMNATLSLALNPRIKKGAFHAGGATLVDVFANPAAQDHPTLVALLGSFTPPILENTPEYLQFLQVAKWILDPADPANYGPIIAASGKPVLSQMGLCDQRVPNDQNRLFTALLGLPVPEPTAGGTGFSQWFINAATGATCPDALADHGFLLDPWPPPPAAPTLTQQAQASFGSFLATSAAQPVTVRP